MPPSDVPPPWIDVTRGTQADERTAAASLPDTSPAGFDAFFGTVDLPAPEGEGLFVGFFDASPSDNGRFFDMSGSSPTESAGFFGEPSWQDDPAVRGLIPDAGQAEQLEPSSPTGAFEDASGNDSDPGLGTFVFVNGVATVVPYTRAEALARGYAVIEYDDELPAAAESAEDVPVVDADRPVVDVPVVDVPVVDVPVVDVPVVDVPVVDVPVADVPVADVPVVDVPAVVVPVADVPVADVPVVAPFRPVEPSRVPDDFGPGLPRPPRSAEPDAILDWLRDLAPVEDTAPAGASGAPRLEADGSAPGIDTVPDVVPASDPWLPAADGPPSVTTFMPFAQPVESTDFAYAPVAPLAQGTAGEAFTEPAVTAPAFTEPVVTEPAFTEPVVTAPAFTAPAFTEPAPLQDRTTASGSETPTRSMSTASGFDLRFATGPWASPPPEIGRDAPVIIRARQLSRTFRKGNREVSVLRGIDLEIREGEFVAITGPSGSGKTTLLHCLAGLDDLTSGTVVVDDLELHALTDGERSRHRSAAMGFAFQNYNLVPSLTALENVELPLMLNDWPQDQSFEEARSALALVGLGERADFLPEELSGGEQQRIAIARSFVGEPKVVWADEPTGNLDDATAAQILQVFRELNHAGLTIVMVTHDPAVSRLAHRVIELSAGQIFQVNQQVA